MRLFALVLIALLFSAAPAHAGFMAGIVSAVGSAFAAIKGSAIGSALLQIALSAGMSLLSRLLQRRQREPGIQTRHTTTGGTDPQGFILGIYPSGGHLVYKNSHGQRNRYINYVIEVSDLAGVDLSRLIIDGEYSDLGETAHPDYGLPILTKRKSGGADRGWIKWYDGTQTAADPMLVSRYSNESGDGTYSEGTISGEGGSVTITGTGTLWTQLPIIGEGGAGAWEIILPNGQRDWFTVVNDTTIELANAYWSVGGQPTTFSGESYEMVAANWQSNDDERPWTADHIGTGIAYAVLTFQFDRDVFDREPDVRFEMRGIALYDPRKDSTVGGSGAHRWDDPETWEFTENPAVMLYNIHRGITTPTGEVWGYGAEAEDLPLEWWVPAMNACDDLVGNDDRTQYVAGFEVRFEDEPAEVCEQLEAACNAQVAELGGVWTIRVGAPGPAVLSITDDDILIDESQQFEPFPGLENIHNGVTITHPSPASLWSGREAEPILNADWEDEDGTRRVADLRLPAVASAEQANQIGWALLRKERRFRTHAITLPPEYAALDLLDVIEWSSPWHGYQDKKFEVQEVARDLSTLRVRVSLREVDPTDDAFDPDFELPEPPLPTVRVPRVEARIPGWRVQPTAITDAAGEGRRPGILITWDGEEAATSGDDMVEVEVRVQATGAVDYNEAVRASSGRDVVETLPVTAYEVRGRLITSDDTGEWTAWAPVLTPDVRLDETDLRDTVRDRLDDMQQKAEDAFAVTDGALEDVLTGSIAELRDDVVIPTRDRLNFEIPQSRSLESIVQGIEDYLATSFLQTADLGKKIRDAGIYVDPQAGTVKIRAIDGLEGRQSQVEINLDAVESELSLKASLAYVDQTVSEAMLDPESIPVVEGLEVRVTDVEVRLDGAEATIDLLSDTLTVADELVTMTSVTGRLDSLEGEIILKVEQSEFDALESRTTDVEVQLTSLDVPTIAFTVQQTRRQLGEAIENEDATVEGLLRGWLEDRDQRESMAFARQQLTASVNEKLESEAQARLELAAQTDSSLATVISQQTAFAGALESASEDITQLESRLDTAEGGVAGNATAITALDTRVTDNEGEIISVASSVTLLEASVDDNSGLISNLQATKVDSAGAVAAVETQISADYGNLSAMASATAFAEATADGITEGFVWKIGAGGLLELVSVETGTDGPVTTAQIRADYIRLDGNVTVTGEFFTQVLGAEEAWIENAMVADASIDNAKLTGSIRSDNWSQGNSGWAIFPGGYAEFQNVFVRGNVTTDSLSLDGSTVGIGPGDVLRVNPEGVNRNEVARGALTDLVFLQETINFDGQSAYGTFVGLGPMTIDMPSDESNVPDQLVLRPGFGGYAPDAPESLTGNFGCSFRFRVRRIRGGNATVIQDWAIAPLWQFQAGDGYLMRVYYGMTQPNITFYVSRPTIQANDTISVDYQYERFRDNNSVDAFVGVDTKSLRAEFFYR